MTPERDFLARAESGCANYAIAYALLRVAAAIERLGTANATSDAVRMILAESTLAIARSIDKVTDMGLIAAMDAAGMSEAVTAALEETLNARRAP
jgi:hypothetical protein